MFIDFSKKDAKSYSTVLSYKPTKGLLKDIPFYFNGTLSGSADNKVTLIPADPGAGKTTIITEYIKFYAKDYKSARRTVDDTGIIVFLFTLEEIREYVAACGLDDSQYAVIVSGDPVKLRDGFGGVLKTKADNVPIVFTTTAMLWSCCKDSFGDLALYHYKGKARALRIWDEEFYVAEPVCLGLDRLAGLKHPLCASFPAIIAEIERIDVLAKTTDFTEVTVSADMRAKAMAAIKSIGDLTTVQQQALTVLHDLAGKTVRLMKGSYERHYLVGERRRLPDVLFYIYYLIHLDRCTHIKFSMN